MVQCCNLWGSKFRKLRNYWATLECRRGIINDFALMLKLLLMNILIYITVIFIQYCSLIKKSLSLISHIYFYNWNVFCANGQFWVIYLVYYYYNFLDILGSRFIWELQKKCFCFRTHWLNICSNKVYKSIKINKHFII